MTLLTKYNVDELGWQRKPGPPRIWRVIDGKKKTAEGKTQRFSIQEIPEDRYEDVLDFMSTVMTQDELICANLDTRCGIFNDQEALSDFRKIWSFCLQLGTAVGAFLVDENNPKPVLAGANMTWVACAATEQAMNRMIEFTSQNMQTLVSFMGNLEKEINVREFYKVDKYISAFGLCVNRPYRGEGLGYRLLKTCDDMSVEYDIEATVTVFSCPAAQKAAAKAGFETLIHRDFVDVRNDEGDEIFPNISGNVCKFMGKRFS